MARLRRGGPGRAGTRNPAGSSTPPPSCLRRIAGRTDRADTHARANARASGALLAGRRRAASEGPRPVRPRTDARADDGARRDRRGPRCSTPDAPAAARRRWLGQDPGRSVGHAPRGRGGHSGGADGADRGAGQAASPHAVAALPVPAALLTGSVKGSARARTLRGLADGSIPLVVGTHALFQEAVAYQIWRSRSSTSSTASACISAC